MSKGSILIYTSAAGQAAPLPGVTLTVTDAGGSVRARLVTDADGFAEAADLPAPDAAYSLDAANTAVQPYAIYRIEAALDGWQPLVLNGVQVFDAQQTVARLNLLPAGAAPASAVSRTGEVETDIVTIPPHTLFAGNGGSGPAPKELLPGSVLDLKAISQKLGISSTPLRDSLIRLEAEGYLTIHPRSKVVINTLELADFPFLYEIMGGLEYTVIAASMEAYTPAIVAEMRRLNAEMKEAILGGDMSVYDSTHYAFHEIFFEVSPNIVAKRILTPIKNRLWDFPRKNFVQDWYLAAVTEHRLIVDAIEARSREKLMHVLKELHWDFKYNERHIRKVYNLG